MNNCLVSIAVLALLSSVYGLALDKKKKALLKRDAREMVFFKTPNNGEGLEENFTVHKKCRILVEHSKVVSAILSSDRSMGLQQDGSTEKKALLLKGIFTKDFEDFAPLLSYAHFPRMVEAQNPKTFKGKDLIVHLSGFSYQKLKSLILISDYLLAPQPLKWLVRAYSKKLYGERSQNVKNFGKDSFVEIYARISFPGIKHLSQQIAQSYLTYDNILKDFLLNIAKNFDEDFCNFFTYEITTEQALFLADMARACKNPSCVCKSICLNDRNIELFRTFPGYLQNNVLSLF